MFSLLPALLLAVAAQAATLTLQTPKFTVTDSTGSQYQSDSISLEHKLGTAVRLAAKDTLKLTFQVVDSETGKGVQPHQTFLRFYDPRTHEEGIQPVRVTTSGKAKFELNPSKPPLALPPTPHADPLEVTLLLGDPRHAPRAVPLFDLVLPRSQPAPAHPSEETYHPRPEIQHTFRPAHRLPPTPVSALAAALVLAPWAALLGMWAQTAPRPARLFSPSILPFVLALGAFEGLLFWYWVALRLGDVLLYAAVLAVPTVFAGRQALASIASARVGRK